MRGQIVKTAAPLLAEWLKPFLNISECVGDKLSRPALCVLAALDQPSLFQYLEMSGDRRLRQMEGFHQLTDRRLPSP